MSSAFVDCDIDRDLVHFEVKHGTLVGIWSSKRLFKIAGLLRTPQFSFRVCVADSKSFAFGDDHGVLKTLLF